MLCFGLFVFYIIYCVKSNLSSVFIADRYVWTLSPVCHSSVLVWLLFFCFKENDTVASENKRPILLSGF